MCRMLEDVGRRWIKGLHRGRVEPTAELRHTQRRQGGSRRCRDVFGPQPVHDGLVVIDEASEPCGVLVCHRAAMRQFDLKCRLGMTCRFDVWTDQQRTSDREIVDSEPRAGRGAGVCGSSGGVDKCVAETGDRPSEFAAVIEHLGVGNVVEEIPPALLDSYVRAGQQVLEFSQICKDAVDIEDDDAIVGGVIVEVSATSSFPYARRGSVPFHASIHTRCRARGAGPTFDAGQKEKVGCWRFASERANSR